MGADGRLPRAHPPPRARLTRSSGGLGLAALLPQVGVDSLWVGVGILVVGLPYTAFYHWWLRRTRVLLPIIAISDQVLPVLFVACFPSLLAPALLFMLAITANTAISFGRRIAMQSASIGFLGVCLVVLSRTPVTPLPALVTYAVLAGFTTLTVGAIYELERELRSRYSDLMGGIDAIVWQQLTQHPSTLYVNEEAQNLLGYPREAWREPRMWSRTVHPDDRMDARRIYRDALRRGVSTVLEYRMIAADGRIVWVQDHVRVETDDMGRTTGVRGVMLDISATRLAQEKANQFVNLVDGIKLALFVFRLEDLNDDERTRDLHYLAATDGLTGLYNHRYLQDHLVLEVERSLRTGVPLGMLMVDVDHFRQYNNRFGHPVGDEVLRRVARLISEHRRVNDVVARYGGEEFALLLINADHRVASNIGERLRARVAAERFPQTHELPGGMLTISVGVASCPTDGTSAASLLQAADAALFRAKQGGRNRVCIAGEPPLFGEPKAVRLQTARVSKSG